MDLDYVCSQMITVIHCSITRLSQEGEVMRVYGDVQPSDHPLCTDTFFAKNLAEKGRKKVPCICHEFDKVVYILLQIPGSGDLLVIGPVCLEKKTGVLNERVKKEHNMTEESSFRLAYCELKILSSSALMLHNVLSGERLSLEDFWKENEIEEQDVMELNQQISDVIFSRQENSAPHNPYDQEVREMTSIRQGNPEMLKASLAETYNGVHGRLARDEVRQAKNIAIVVITLASRAAIKGGMLPEESFSMVDAYISSIEGMENPVKIQAMMRQAEYDYAERVKQIAEKKTGNILVERTKNYIFQHLHDEITISEISVAIGVNNTYLSSLFHKEEGVTIQQYISREKIRLAENMLRYSSYEVRDISNYLSFCSQSYFGSVFKKQTDLSPAKYRKKYKKFKIKEPK